MPFQCELFVIISVFGSNSNCYLLPCHYTIDKHPCIMFCTMELNNLDKLFLRQYIGCDNAHMSPSPGSKVLLRKSDPNLL